MEIKTVAIVGAGALGVMMGDFCVRNLGRDAVRFVADAGRVRRYEQEGIYCNGALCAFHYSDGQGGEIADLVIFATKADGLEQAVLQVEPIVGPDTILISLLNGVTSEEIIGSVLGEEKVIYTVAQGMDAVKTGNRLEYRMPGELRIGYPPEQEEKRARLLALTAFLDQIGFRYTVEEDIISRMWGKLMMNVGVNQCCMVYECGYEGLQRPGQARETMLAAMDEVRKVAFCAGIVLSRKDRDDYVALLDSLTPAGMPSMRQDALAGRTTEVELFAGTILRFAGEYGLNVPINKGLYQQIREMEAAF